MPVYRRMRNWEKVIYVGLGVSIGALLLALIVLIVMALSSSARAHDHARPDLMPWYKSLTSRKGPCCDGSDAMKLEDPQWRIVDDHYEVLLSGQWIEVPETAMVQGTNLDGKALVWPYYVDGQLIGIRCFMAGVMG